MADSSFSFHHAKQQLENEMTDRQLRLMSILTGQAEGLAAEKELLESEIEDRNFAIEKLEAQSCCNYCGTQVDVPETFRVRITKYGERLPTINLEMEKVCVSAECADCSSNYDWHYEPRRVLATTNEIVRAIEMLACSEQWQELKKFAYQRAQRFPANLGKTGEDLFQEALVSTLEGRKKWKMAAVDIFGHLLFAMKNIAHSWQEKFYRWGSTLEAVTHNAEGDELSRLATAQSSNPSADQCLSARDEVERLFGKFREDEVATAILQAQLKGATTAREIMQEQKLTKRQYEAARRRIRSQKSVLIVEECDQVLELFARFLRAMDFAVVTASTAIEALHLYRKCGPFDVVMMSYSPAVNCVDLAMNIRKRSPSQNMIITTTYSSEEDVVRPGELADLPILLKPFRKTELRAVLDSFANRVKEQPASRCRQKRRRITTGGKKRLVQPFSASGRPRQGETLKATPPS
jgi:DNA-binding NarL/FixJ family response regulator